MQTMVISILSYVFIVGGTILLAIAFNNLYKRLRLSTANSIEYFTIINNRLIDIQEFRLKTVKNIAYLKERIEKREPKNEYDMGTILPNNQVEISLIQKQAEILQGYIADDKNNKCLTIFGLIFIGIGSIIQILITIINTKINI
ncbi:MAG: hypothetical protein HPY53_03900 [Brevinematales bacterium]|nr:hypothetical protein [Brevinematales bacterium]